MRKLEFRTARMQHQSSTTVTATVFDPVRPNHLGQIAFALVAVGLGGALMWHDWGWWVALAGVALGMANDVRPRRRPRETQVVCRPGSIRIPRTGLIRARDIEGATTARVGDRVAIVLAHRRRNRTPIVLDVEGDAALAAICKSLGIGHHGFGRVDFVPRATDAARAQYVVNAFTLATFATTLVTPLQELALIVAAPMACVVATLAFVRAVTVPSIVRVTSGGVFLPLYGSTFIPFHAIEEIVLRPHELLFRVRSENEVIVHVLPVSTSTWARQGCSRAELEHLVAQIRAAVDRAHGTFALKSEPALAKQLERGADEPLAGWLARIDTIGLGAGYRATVYDAAELWTLLEDPEATADVRTAAARVLARLDRKTLRVRVAGVLETVRDDETRTRIAESIEEAALDPDERSAARPLLE